MNLFFKNLWWVLLTLVLIAVLFAGFSDSFTKPEQITLDELAISILAGEVERIEVSGSDLEITFRDEEREIVKAKKEEEASLSETLRNYGVEGEVLRGVIVEIKDPGGLRFWASILIPSLLPILIIVLIVWWIFRNAKSGMNQAFSFGQSQLKSFSSLKNKVLFDDVAGLTEAKQELKEVVEFLKNPKKFKDLGAKIPRGVLLVGSPGTGKTLIARAVAGEAGVPFFYMSGSEFVEMFVGVGASRTRDTFATVKKASPAILFIDEIDAIGRQRGAGLGGGNDEREQTLNQILVEMDGFDRDARVIVLAATNRPDVLDPALLRPGRFDRRIMLDLPDIEEREAILTIHAKDKKTAKETDLRRVAVRTPGFSGADLANLMNEAAIFAARQGKKEISQLDILSSIEKVILGPEKRSRIISEREKKTIAYHEAGHALVAAAMPEADPVQKVSIVSRGMAGGYTLKLPLDDNRLKTKSQFLADLAMMLGGYAAEQIVFKDITTGASNDLQKVYQVARAITVKYGMSDKIGPVAFTDHDDNVFLGKEIISRPHYSDEMAKLIDSEVEKFIHGALKTAKEVLTDKREALDKIAEALLEKEVLEYEEFYEVVGRFGIEKPEGEKRGKEED